jgi:eukaryotic-like serine/threonine-protein kinase
VKRCPQCNRVETDEALKFCRVDGATLVNDSSSIDQETGTVKLGSGQVASETATGILPQAPDANVNRATAPTAVLSTLPQATTDTLVKPRKRKTVIIVGVIAVVALAVAAAFVVNAYLSKTKTAAIESIAVMPFVNASGNADAEYLSDGMTETLISSLSNLQNLNVKPRSTVFRYKGKETTAQTIAKELNVQAILTGRVMQRGQDISLYVELTDVSLDRVVWSETYNRKQSDLVALQSEIARDVSGKLKSKLSNADVAKVEKNSNVNPDAYQLYLKARYHYNKLTDDGYRKAIEYFRQAAELDPNYARAYAGLAESYFGLSDQFEPPNEVMPKARVAAEKALSLDNSLAEAHLSLGLVRMFYELDWAHAEREFQLATTLDPNYADGYLFYSRLLLSEGRFQEAVKACEIAARVEPLSPVYSAYLGVLLSYTERSSEAVAQGTKALELNDSFPIGHFYLGTVYQRLGEFEKAIAEYKKAFELNRNARYLMALGNVYAVAGQREKALRVLSDLTEMKKERYVSSFFFAVVHAGLNNRDESFALIGKAFEEHADSLAGMKTSVLMDNLRPDPRFKDMLKRANFPE